MAGEISTRATRALIQAAREAGAEPLLPSGEEDRISKLEAWVSNEDFVLLAAAAREAAKEEEIARRAGRNIILDPQGGLDQALGLQAQTRDALLHFPRLMKLVDRNHTVAVSSDNGRGLRVSVSMPRDGFHTRDHCLLVRGLLEGVLTATASAHFTIRESRCQVPIDQAGTIAGETYRIDAEGHLQCLNAAGAEKDLGPGPGEAPVNVGGTTYGCPACEFLVNWDQAKETRPRGPRRLRQLLKVLWPRVISKEKFQALVSWQRGPIRWESSYDLTRLKYLSFLLVGLLALLPAASAVFLGPAGHPEALAVGLVLAVIVLLSGITILRSGLASARVMQTKVENAETVLQGSGVAVVTILPDFTIAYANSPALARHGQVIGRKCYEAFRWDSRPCPSCKLPLALAEGERAAMECRYLDQEGWEKWYYVTLSPLRDEDDNIVGMAHAAIDVQEKKELELELEDKSRALLESEAKYRNYMSNAADAILITDLEFKVLESNRQMAELTGLPDKDSLSGAGLFESGIIPESERERLRGLASRMLADRHARQFEMELLRRDGKTIAVEVRSIPVFIAEKPAGLQSIFRDVTARKREEFEKNLLLSISSSIKEAPDLDSLTDNCLAGICAIMNVPVAALFLIEQETNELKLAAHQGFNPKSITEIAIQAVDWSSSGVASRTALLKRTILVSDLSELRLLPGTRESVAALGVRSLFCTPLMVEARLQGVILLMSRDSRDFAEERQATIKHVANELALGIARQGLLEMIQKKNKELMEKNREIENTTMQLLQSEKMASIGQLAAGVAHEINNPMGYISSNLNVLDEYREDLLQVFAAYEQAMTAIAGREDPHLKDAMKIVGSLQEKIKPQELLAEFAAIVKESQEGTRRVKAIIQGLKDFSHPESGAPQWLDLNQGLESTLNIVWNEIKYKAKVEKNFGDLPQVKGFPQELNQVFMNLLVNAAQAIREQGEISVRTRTEGNFVLVEISDTGCGIPAENLSRIFDPFFTTKEVGKGTGLGLAISYRIVQKHGGQLTVQSEVGKGTTFIIRLPITGPEILKEAL